MGQVLWRIYFFGRLQAQSDQSTLNHLSMRRIGALLACLALGAPDPIPREELLDRLWPEEPVETARNRLRVLLSALRQQLEPEGAEPNSVLAAGRNAVSLLPSAFSSDYHDFLQALEAAKAAASDHDRIAHLESALTLYRGEFLAGFYDEWILSERSRLADLRYQALRELVRCCMQVNAPERAVDYARQAVAAEPLDEEAHCALMRLYSAMGQPSAGLRQYEQLKRLLREEMQAQPSEEARQLAAELEAKLGHGAAPSKRSVRPMMLRAGERGEVEQHFPANLPPRLTRFFGRAEEIATLRAMLSPNGSTRLVSLLGPGGTGKTRLALETAEQLKAGYEGRVYFAALAEIVDPNLIGRAIARALLLPPTPGLDPLSQAMTALSQTHALLVLDNMEQLLPEAGGQVEHLLSEVPSLRCLLTSRLSAGIEGEREVVLEPLPTPAAGEEIENEPEGVAPLLLDYPSVALFVDRASAVRSDFALTANNAQDVAQLCRMLEGMPLAIELAAARSRVMTPGEMRKQTSSLLDWLVDVRGGKTARHRSLRATLEWSYRLLTPGERRFFRALSVFTGGFSAEAAGYVGLGEGTEALEALAMLERLRATSLLYVVETPQAKTLFGMLEMLHEFGRERLVEMGEEAETRRRHLAYYAAAFGEREGQPLPRDPAEVARIAAEDENLRGALEFGLRAGATREEANLALDLACALARYWEMQGHWSEGRAHLRRALSLATTAERQEARLKLLQSGGVLANLQGDYQEARSLSEEGLALAQAMSDLQSSAGCLSNLGNIAFHLGDYACAQERLEEALQIYRQTADWRGIAGCLADLGNVAFFLGDHKEAQRWLEEALALYRPQADWQGAASVLVKLGNVLRNQGRYAEGRARLMEALEMLQEAGNRQGVASCLHGLGLAAFFQRNYAEAHNRLTESLQMYQEIGHLRGVAANLLYLGSIARDQGDTKDAFSYYTQALGICLKTGERRNYAACLLGLGNVAMEESDAAESLVRYKEALAIEQAINNSGGIANCLAVMGRLAIVQNDLVGAHTRLAEALQIYHKMEVLPGVVEMVEAHALLAQRSGRAESAARLAGAASALQKQVGYSLPLFEQRQHEEMVTSLRSTLGAEAFAAAWREGEALSTDEVVAAILIFPANFKPSSTQP